MTDVSVRMPVGAHPGSEARTESDTHIRWFEDLSLADADLVGGKAANLGELTRAELPVPPGFAVTATAFLDALDDAGRRAELRQLLAGVDPAQPDDLATRALQARTLVSAMEMPDRVRDRILDAYRQLQERAPGPVAVRSSAAGEDSAAASFAGMNETFTNVLDADELVDRVRACWASVYGERVVTYRAARQMASEPAIAVVVQHMVNADRSGVLFTTDPTDAASRAVVIEAAWGQGEVVVGGQVEPDTYVVDRLDGGDVALSRVRIGVKTHEIVAGADGHDERRDLSPQRGRARVLDDDLVVTLARIGLGAERYFGVPQDMEWCTEGGVTPRGETPTIWLVQSRPITTLVAPQTGSGPSTGDIGTDADAAPILTGLAASHGTGVGRVRVLASPKEGAKLAAGDVLVAAMTKPDWLPLMRRAAAVVTDGGGVTCHAAIVSRELGIPCVVGTRTATTTLRDDELVTVDADHGKVYAGARTAPAPPTLSGAAVGAASGAPAALGTRILVNLALPEEAERAALLPVDGVGLLRAELLITEALAGRHPRALMAEGKSAEFVDAMAAALARIGTAFGERPVVYRTIDFRTNEFRDLAGGEAYEPVEANPMIGYRGCYRYVNEPDLFGLELEALARARVDAPNVHVMIPFVRTAWELEAVFGSDRPEPARRGPPAPALGHGRGPLGCLLVARLRRPRHPRRVDRQQRPHPAHARRRP